ncbi:hypothetical protein Tco_0122960 [Tanacetum coccineum]
MLAEVVDLSSDAGLEADDKDVVFLYDANYPLTDAKIRMFKEIPTTSRGLRRQLASTFTRSRAPIASTSRRQPGPRCVLPLFAPNALNAPPPFPHIKEVQVLAILYPFFCMLIVYLYVDVLVPFGLLILCSVLS